MQIFHFGQTKNYSFDLKPGANRRNIVGSCCVRFHVAKSLTSLKLWATTPNNTNNMQEGVQTDATYNNPTMLRPFAPGLSYYNFPWNDD